MTQEGVISMRESVCSELLHHLDADGSLQVGRSPDSVSTWVNSANLPWSLGRLLELNWPQRGGQLSHLWINSAVEIIEDECLAELLKSRFLPIGAAVNGDRLVIRLNAEQCEVGFITHEEYHDNIDSLHQVYQRIARNLDSLLWRIAEGRYVPTDYYAAKDFNAFLSEESVSK